MQQRMRKSCARAHARMHARERCDVEQNDVIERGRVLAGQQRSLDGEDWANINYYNECVGYNQYVITNMLPAWTTAP